MVTSHWWPRLTWHLVPLMTQSPFDRTAVVRMSLSDEPTPGSEMLSEKMTSPEAMPGSSRARCSGVPQAINQH